VLEHKLTEPRVMRIAHIHVRIRMKSFRFRTPMRRSAGASEQMVD